MLECKYRENLPLTDMWYINGWVESIVLRRKVEGFFHSEVGTIEREYTIAGNQLMLTRRHTAKQKGFWGFNCKRSSKGRSLEAILEVKKSADTRGITERENAEDSEKINNIKGDFT